MEYSVVNQVINNNPQARDLYPQFSRGTLLLPSSNTATLDEIA